MRKNHQSPSALFTRPVVLALTLCSASALLATLAFAARTKAGATTLSRSIRLSPAQTGVNAAGIQPCISLGDRINVSVLLPDGSNASDCLPLTTAGVPRFMADRAANTSAAGGLGTITTAAGSVGNGPGNSLGQIPLNVAYTAPDAQHPKGTLYISDWAYYNVVRRLDLFTGQETVVAGNGGTGFNGDGPATSVELKYPWGIAPDSQGNAYIADGQRVRRLDPSGQLVTKVDNSVLLASGIPPAPGGGGTFSPTGLVMDNQGKLIIADWAGERILKFDPTSGLVTVVAGTGYFGYNRKQKRLRLDREQTFGSSRFRFYKRDIRAVDQTVRVGLMAAIARGRFV